MDAGSPATATASASARARQRAVAADDDERAHAVRLQHLARASLSVGGGEHLGARRAEHGASAPRGLVDGAQLERADASVEQPRVPLLDTEHFETERGGDARGAAQGRVHSGGIASARQQREPFASGQAQHGLIIAEEG